MGRRTSIFEDVMDLPWQVGAVLAFLCYPAALLLSVFLSSNPVLEAMSSVPLKLWPLFATLFGFASLMSFVIGRKKKKLFKQNQSLEEIRNLSWQQFELYVGQYFREQGYFVVETPEGPDGGIDLVLRKDGEKIYVQCKHWKAYKVGVEKVRALLGSITAGGADHGVLVTTGDYTSSARVFANQHGIKLINGSELEYLIRVSPDQDLLHPNLGDVNPTCPVCNSTMIKRTAKKGHNAGNQFWGCSKYPACRGTRSI